MAITLTPQTALATLTPLSVLAASYDGLLCDIWGVLHNGVAAFDDAVDALCRYRAQGGIVILITNAPRSHLEIYPQLERFGVPRQAFDAVVTSGDVTSLLIRKSPDTPLFHFGPARDHSILFGLRNPIVGISGAKLCLLTGPLDDDIETVDVYENLLKELRDNEVTMICANPDLTVRSGFRMVICAGSIAARYAQMGGAVIQSGKPEAEIYNAAVEKIANFAGRVIPKNRLLAVGDGLPTDIKGAAQNGFDAYFVTGGLHANELGDMGIPENVSQTISQITIRYPDISLVGVCDRLRWT